MYEPPGTTVLHVDLDAFFVSMELLRHPELRGRPVIVAGGLGPRGVVNTCSYEARVFGVRSAMPLSTARRLCPSAVVLASDFGYYGPASKRFHEILRTFTPIVEPAGADEAYLDVTGMELIYGDAPRIGQLIRSAVRSALGITASVGVAANKLVAKVASDAAKPDGILVVQPGGEAAFLAPRPLRELPMIGPKTAAALAGLGVRTIGDVAALSADLLEGRLGPHGRDLHERALGIHRGAVVGARNGNRSISRERTFARDESDRRTLLAVLRGQAERVAGDLLRQGKAARTVSLKLRFPPFETFTRSNSPPRPILVADDLVNATLPLFDRVWAENDQRPLRLLGIGVMNLQERARQLAFGESIGPDTLARTLDDLRRRFGSTIVRRATELPVLSAGDSVRGP